MPSKNGYEKDGPLKEQSWKLMPGDPPDGGFGWMVVFAGFMQHVIVLGVAYTIGVYYPTFQSVEDLGADTSTVAWVATAHLCTLYASGPLAGYLISRFSTLFVGFIGSLIVAAGCIVAAFANNIYIVIVCFGFLSGTGCGFMFISAVTAVSRWFNKKRSLATGLAVSGAGVGVMTFSPLLRFLIDHWGRREALLIEGALALNGCVFALLLRPVPPKKVLVKATSKDVIYKVPKSLQNADVEKHELDEIQPLQKAPLETLPVKETPKPNGHIGSAREMWTDLNFWLFNLSQVFTFMSASGPLVYLFSRAVKDLGIDSPNAALIVSAMGVFNTVGRILFGGLGNLLPRFRFYLLAISIVVFGAATTIATWGHGFWELAAFASVFGACYGSMFALTSVVLVDLFGLALFQTVYGGVGVFRGVAVICSPPLYTWLIRMSNNNHVQLFVVTGVLGVVGGALLLLIPVNNRIRRMRHR